MDGGLGGGAGGLFKICCVFGEASWDMKAHSALQRRETVLLPSLQTPSPPVNVSAQCLQWILKAKSQWPFVSPEQSTINSAVDGAGSCEKAMVMNVHDGLGQARIAAGREEGQSPVSALLPPRDGLAAQPMWVVLSVPSFPEASGNCTSGPGTHLPSPPALKSHKVDRRSYRASSRPQSTLQHGGFTGRTAQKGTPPLTPCPRHAFLHSSRVSDSVLQSGGVGGMRGCALCTSRPAGEVDAEHTPTRAHTHTCRSVPAGRSVPRADTSVRERH